MYDKKRFIFIGVSSLFLLLVVAGLAVNVSKTMPGNALVYVNDETKEYYAPNCVRDVQPLRLITIREALSLGYVPEKNCMKSGEFLQKGRSLAGLLLERVGILKEVPPRWNKDGSWNY
ncbi:MAG: hypothetical protein E3K37_14975 [Candidatus Kuenenia sp.]|nr:hypothetical protein [Candidatus Kuenenia hertensis]